MGASTGNTRSPLRRLARILGIIALVFVVAIGVSSFIAWRKANQPPEWWSPLNASDPQVDRSARVVENTIADQVHRVRPIPAGAVEPATWTMVIKDAEADAWLCARLKEWMLNRNERLAWPSNASNPQVSFDEGVVRIGVEVAENAGEKGRVVSATLNPTVEADGSLWLRVNTFAIGRFQVPAATIADAGGVLTGMLPTDLRNDANITNFMEVISGKRSLSKDTVIKLSDGRRVQIVRMTPKPGELEIECRTLPRQP